MVFATRPMDESGGDPLPAPGDPSPLVVSLRSRAVARQACSPSSDMGRKRREETASLPFPSLDGPTMMLVFNDGFCQKRCQ